LSCQELALPDGELGGTVAHQIRNGPIGYPQIARSIELRAPRAAKNRERAVVEQSRVRVRHAVVAEVRQLSGGELGDGARPQYEIRAIGDPEISELSKANPAGRSKNALSLENCGDGLPLTARAGGSNSFTDGPKRLGTQRPPLVEGVEVGVAVGAMVVVAVAV